MPDSNYNAQKVVVDFRIGNVSIPVNSLVLNHTINELPYVEVTTQLDNQDAPQTGIAKIGHVKIDLKQYGKLNKITQEKILNNFHLTPDVGMTIRDGEGSELKFSGLLGQPSFRIKEGQVFLGFNAIHQMAVLQAFNSQIYYDVQNYTQPFFDSYFSDTDSPIKFTSTLPRKDEPDPLAILKALGNIPKYLESFSDKESKTDSISQRIRVIVEGLHQRFKGEVLVDTGEMDILPVFNLNDRALTYVQQFLKASDLFTVINGIASPYFVDTMLHLSIYRLLTGSPNFYASVQEFCRTFFFQMNATWDGQAWMEHLFTNQDPEGRLMKVALADIQFTMGHLFEIPVRQVLIQADGSDFYLFQSTFGIKDGETPLAFTPTPYGPMVPIALADGTNSLRVIARYPSTIPRTAVGNYYVLQAPEWICPSNFLVKDIGIDPPDHISKFDRALASFKKLEDNHRLRKDGMIHVLDYVAEAAYRDLLLRDSQAHFSIPFNAQVVPGRTYDIYSMDEHLIFTGYLETVRHTIHVDDTGGTAITDVKFTHVLAPNAQLDALDHPDAFIRPKIGVTGETGNQTLADEIARTA